MRTYTELSQLSTIEDRYEYLKIGGSIGVDTFGFDRWMNQKFYRSREWRQVRDFVNARDLGTDLGIEAFPISGSIYIHHLNPITVVDITEATENLLDPEYLISCALRTHNAVHFGDRSLLPQEFVPRRPGDTNLW